MERNSENPKHPDKRNPENNIDSPINIQGTESRNKDLKSLTNDEDASVDPNEVPDKPSFKSSEDQQENNSGRFDGSIGI